MTLTQADGATTIDPHWPGPFFETPTSLPPAAPRSSPSRRFAAHARRLDLRRLAAKEELLVRLFEGRTEKVLAEVAAAASGAGSPRERLSAMARAYVLGVLRNLDSVHVYLREEHSLPPSALQQVHREQKAMRDHFERVIVEGTSRGDFVQGDPKLAALALLGMCTWVHRWYRPRGRLTESAVADDFAERAVRMLSP